MKKILLLVLLFATLNAFPQGKITAIFYQSENCKHCLDVKEQVLPLLTQKYVDQLEWRPVVTSNNPEGLRELVATFKRMGFEHPRVPAILVGDRLLVGFNEISVELEGALNEAIAANKTAVSDGGAVDLAEIFNKIPVMVIIVSGLIDGINPCAFAVIVFFVSFLAVYGYRRRDVIYVGSAYCLAVFITYLLIGLGLFQFLYRLSNIYVVINAFYSFVALVCFVLAGFALYDFWQYKRTGSPSEQILQLPPFLKKRINVVIGSQLRHGRQKSAGALVVSSLLVGFLVSLLEAVCTGQIYLPIIVSLLKYPHLRLRAASFLILYNLMFIAPLVLIFLLSLAGISSEGFNVFLKRHLGLIKILLALLFIGLGIFVVGYEIIYAKLLPFFERVVMVWVR